MKIAFLVSSLGSGGAERVASTLASAWAARGDAVMLIPTFSGGGRPFYALNPRVRLVFLAELAGAASARRKRYLRRLHILRTLIATHEADVVVSFMPNVNIAALAATAFTGIPCIVCERSDPSMLPMSWGWKVACRLFYRAADAVAVQTEAVAARIHRLYGGLRTVSILPNPLPFERGDEAIRDVGPGSRRVLLSMGRLSEEKRVDVIIAAFAELAAACPDWDLHIYGDGPLRAELQAIVDRSGLSERIRLLGATRDPWRIMARAHAFTMASRYEGFPNALLEAMGMGLACLATDCPSGPREITRDGTDARLVAVDDFAAFQTTLRELMTDTQLRNELGARAQTSVFVRFGLPAVLQKWDALFSDLGVRR